MLYTPAFWALFFANLTTVASFGTFFLFPLFITRHGGSETGIGLVMGIFAMASTLCRPWVAEMIDRLGRRKSFLAGSLLMAVSPLGYLAFLDGIDWPSLLLLRMVHGIALAICFTAVFTYVADLLPSAHLNEGIGIFGISGLTGLALGPLLAEAVLDRFGFMALFLLASLLASISLVLAFSLPESKRVEESGTPFSFFDLLSRPKFRRVGALSLFFGFGLAATGNFVAPLAEQRQLPFISLFFICYAAAAAAIRLVGGRLTDRIGESRMLPYALLVCTVGLFTLSLANTGFTLALAGVLAGSGHGLLFPVLNTLAIRDEPFELRGKATGIFTGGIDSGNFLGSILLGLIGDFAGLPSLFVIAGGVLLLGLTIKSSPQRGC